MTAINTPLGHGNTQGFRRGMFAGIAASVLLAAIMTTAAFASGLIELPQVTVAADEAPAVVVQPGPNVQLAPDAVHPQHLQDVVVQPAPNVQPGSNVQPALDLWPMMEYDQHNPLRKGNRAMY